MATEFDRNPTDALYLKRNNTKLSIFKFLLDFHRILSSIKIENNALFVVECCYD